MKSNINHTKKNFVVNNITD